MSLRFEGERMTPDVLDPSLRDQLYFMIERGITFPFGMLYGRESHLSRYRFAAKEYAFQGKRILDIGCGVGYGTDILKASGVELVVGGEIDSASIRYAQERYGREGLSFLQANAEDLSFLPASFDVVVCLEVVEHLRNPNGFLERVGEVLTKDGVLIVSTPNRTIINPGASLKDKPKNKFHLREYSREDFEALLKQFFDEVELFGLFNPQADRRGNPFVRRMKLLGNLVRLEKVVEVGPLRENKEPSNIVAVCKSKKE